MAQKMRCRVRSITRKSFSFEKSSRAAENVLKGMSYGKSEHAATFMHAPDPMEGYVERPRTQIEVWRREK